MPIFWSGNPIRLGIQRACGLELTDDIMKYRFVRPHLLDMPVTVEASSSRESRQVRRRRLASDIEHLRRAWAISQACPGDEGAPHDLSGQATGIEGDRA